MPLKSPVRTSNSVNCARCFHTDHAHDGGGVSLMQRGGCRIPGCECDEFMDRIPPIDEELT